MPQSAGLVKRRAVALVALAQSFETMQRTRKRPVRLIRPMPEALVLAEVMNAEPPPGIGTGVVPRFVQVSGALSVSICHWKLNGPSPCGLTLKRAVLRPQIALPTGCDSKPTGVPKDRWSMPKPSPVEMLERLLLSRISLMGVPPQRGIDADVSLASRVDGEARACEQPAHVAPR